MVAVEFHFLRLIDSRTWFAHFLVLSSNAFSCVTHASIVTDLQGLDTHIKAISTHAFCYDSRPNYQYRMEWLVQNHLVGGFLNSNIRKLCNANFLTVGDEVFVVATEGARRCLSITKFADGPNFMNCSLFRASESLTS